MGIVIPTQKEPRRMNADKKPWLFLKRINAWNPLANVRELSVPPVYQSEASAAQTEKVRARWGFIGPIP
jgi:hypothetical protein